MATTTDYTKMMKDMMGAMPMDTTAFTDMFKTQAALGEKMSKVALEAAEKSTEVSTKWTKATLAKAGELSTAKEDPADYTKAMTDFASASAETAAEHVAAFAEIAKKSADGHRRAADGCWQRHAGRNHCCCQESHRHGHESNESRNRQVRRFGSLPCGSVPPDS